MIATGAIGATGCQNRPWTSCFGGLDRSKKGRNKRVRCLSARQLSPNKQEWARSYNVYLFYLLPIPTSHLGLETPWKLEQDLNAVETQNETRYFIAELAGEETRYMNSISILVNGWRQNTRCKLRSQAWLKLISLSQSERPWKAGSSDWIYYGYVLGIGYSSSRVGV